jgi:hypothetical protein
VRGRKLAVAVIGAVLMVAGVAALVLPGPGVLMILAGLVVLSAEFEWAERRVDTVRDKAFDVSAAGVATWPRIVFSTLSALVVVGVGIWWCTEPTIPEFWILGPELPFAGPGTGIAIIVSGLIALGLLGYSLKRFRFGGETPPGEQEPAGSESA